MTESVLEIDRENNKATMSLDMYEDLIDDAQFLHALKAAGVDNWYGYEEAQDIMKEWHND